MNDDSEDTTVPLPSRGRHHAAKRDAVRVSDLLERAVHDGDPLRLNWPQDGFSRVRPYVAREWPTGVLPRLDDQPDTAGGG